MTKLGAARRVQHKQKEAYGRSFKRKENIFKTRIK
jgi:hypothetical protein